MVDFPNSILSLPWANQVGKRDRLEPYGGSPVFGNIDVPNKPPRITNPYNIDPDPFGPILGYDLNGNPRWSASDPYAPPNLVPAVTAEQPRYTPSFKPARYGTTYSVTDAQSDYQPAPYTGNEPAWTTVAPGTTAPNTPAPIDKTYKPWWAAGVSLLTGAQPATPPTQQSSHTPATSWTPESLGHGSNEGQDDFYKNHPEYTPYGPTYYADKYGVTNTATGQGAGQANAGNPSIPAIMTGNPLIDGLNLISQLSGNGPAITTPNAFFGVDIGGLIARLSIIVLGMIFVAVGLSLFGGTNPVNVVVNTVKGKP